MQGNRTTPQLLNFAVDRSDNLPAHHVNLLLFAELILIVGVISLSNIIPDCLPSIENSKRIISYASYTYETAGAYNYMYYLYIEFS